MKTHLAEGYRVRARLSWTIGLVKFCLATVLLCLGGSGAMAQTLERFEFSKPLLGTVVEVTLYAPTETVATEAASAAFARIAALNRVLSDYNSDSEVSRLCQTAGTGMKVEVSAELFEMLSRSASLSEATDGAFDVTISPVIKLWRIARKERQLPDPQQLAAARELVGWKNVKLDAETRTVELLRPGMQLDFGGIAKGYIAEQARDVLTKRGLTRCLIAIGGDIAAGSPPPEEDGWRIGVAPLDKPAGPPSRLLRLKNCSVSTAGDAFQFVEIDGVRYSHIVDPKTGLGLTERCSVTVIATEGATADGLDTAVVLVGPERGLKLIEHFKDNAALIVVAGDDGPSVRESPGFAKFVIQPE